MSLESFYGGKQGISPVIRNSFQYVDVNDIAYKAARAAGASAAELAPYTMDVMLADSNYEDVWYNELCIIDTKNKANKNNGKLYRRTLKGRGDADLENHSAEYIGQIVGPAGVNPFIAFKSLEGVKSKATENYIVNDDTIVNWPNSETSTSTLKPNDGDDLYIFDAGQMNNMIVPGKDGDEYNDTIRYTWFNMVDNTTEDETQSLVYLGFEIPYPSLDIGVTNVDWDEEAKINKYSGEGYDEHPFYHSWNINIPRGVRGNAAGNIRLAQYKDFRNTGGDNSKPFLYDFENSVSEVNTLRGVFDITEVTPAIFNNQTAEELAAHQDTPFWVYDYTFYDKALNDTAEDRSKTYTFYLGSYKEISDITFDEQGTVTFIYSDTTDKEFSQIIQWIKEVSITDGGLITFVYNTVDNDNQNKTYKKQLPFPDSLKISEDGEITLYLKDDGGTTPLPLLTQWDNEDPFDLNYVKTIEMDDDTKVLKYTTYPKDNGEELNNGAGLNYIQAMTIDSNYHLLAYYGSSQYRPTQEDVAAGIKDGYPVIIINQTDNHNIVEWKGQRFRDGIDYEGIENSQGQYWQDFGLMRETQNGIRVLSTFNLEDYPYFSALESYTVSQFISDVLNVQYWDDAETIPNPYYNGKIGDEVDYNGDPLRGTFCYTTLISGGSAFYYDYDAHTWAYAGAWGESDKTDANIELEDGSLLGNKSLSDTAVVFVEKQTKAKTNNLPNLYW